MIPRLVVAKCGYVFISGPLLGAERVRVCILRGTRMGVLSIRILLLKVQLKEVGPIFSPCTNFCWNISSSDPLEDESIVLLVMRLALYHLSSRTVLKPFAFEP